MNRFDKVIVRDDLWEYWKIDFFSYFSTETQRYVCMTKSWQYCIPYSEEVDKYIGTKEYIKNNKI